MNRALLNKITLVLAVVGCIIALVLSYEHFFPVADVGCRAVGGNCHATIESKYGKLGPIPTSILGLGMYLTVAGICILRARTVAGKNTPGSDEKPLGIALFGISALAFCISWWLQYTSFFVILSFCPWCFASALTVTAIFLVNGYDFLILGRTLTGEQKMLSGVVCFIGVMLSFMYGPTLLDQYRLITGPPRPTTVDLPPGAKPILHPHEVGTHPREEILTKDLDYRGKPTALYTIVEFADYGCGHCKEASEAMEKLRLRYPDRYRLAFRNFVLGRWPYSGTEAQAAEAAAKQGKYWEMHDTMFQHQAEVEGAGFGVPNIMRWARSIGLDVEKLKSDMDTHAIRGTVNHDHEIGYINNVRLTPSFFVVPADPNGKIMMITGGIDAEAVLSNLNDPFWKGNPSRLKNPETQNPPMVDSGSVRM